MAKTELGIYKLKESDKPKRGRPTDDRKGRMLNVRVSDDINRFICRNALIKEISESEFVRLVLQEKLDAERERARIRKAENEILRQKALEEMREKGLFFNVKRESNSTDGKVITK